MSEEELRVVLRKFNAQEDEALIYSSWRNSLWYASGLPKTRSDGFYRAASRQIREMLENEAIQVRIACLLEDPAVILGYSVLEGSHLHWIYVKSEFRKKGIGSLLAGKGIETVSFPVTQVAHAIVRKKKLRFIRGNGHE